MSEIQESPPPAENTINLDTLSLEQLNQFKQQEDARLQNITIQYGNLRAGHSRFVAAKEALAQASKPEMENTEIFVPLTPSLYVPGKIKDSSKVMLDLGTGFYAEKSAKDALDFLERKIRLVDANSVNVMKAIQACRKNSEAVSMTMQGKMMEIRARQEGAKYKESVESST